MGDGTPTRIKVDNGLGLIWFIGWLFTIAYSQLSFWQGALGLIIWPYYLGATLR